MGSCLPRLSLFKVACTLISTLNHFIIAVYFYPGASAFSHTFSFIFFLLFSLTHTLGMIHPTSCSQNVGNGWKKYERFICHQRRWCHDPHLVRVRFLGLCFDQKSTERCWRYTRCVLNAMTCLLIGGDSFFSFFFWSFDFLCIFACNFHNLIYSHKWHYCRNQTKPSLIQFCRTHCHCQESGKIFRVNVYASFATER